MTVPHQRILAGLLCLGAFLLTVLTLICVRGLLLHEFWMGAAAGILSAALIIVSWRVAWGSWPANRGEGSVGPWARVAVLGAFPAALLGAILDCGRFAGCTPLCGLLASVWVPLLSLLAVAAMVRPHRWILLSITLLSYALLVPHCRCYNPPNAFWIDWLGLSPACFTGAFGVGLLAVGSTASRRWTAAAACVGWLTAAALVAFAILHHGFRIPW